MLSRPSPRPAAIALASVLAASLATALAAAPALACSTPEDVNAHFSKVHQAYLAKAPTMSAEQFQAWAYHLERFSAAVGAGDMAGACVALDRGAAELGFVVTLRDPGSAPGDAPGSAPGDGSGGGSDRAAGGTAASASWPAAAEPAGGADGMLSGVAGNDQYNAVDVYGDGSIVLAGELDAGTPGDTVAIISKLGSGGEVLWTLKSDPGGWDRHAAVVALPDGGAVAVGTTRDPATSADAGWAMLIGAGGAALGEKRIERRGGASFNAALGLPDGGLVLAGYSGNPSALWIVGLDAQGRQAFEGGYETAGSAEATALLRLDDGRIAAVGTVHLQDGTTAGLVAMFSPAGELLWAKEEFPEFNTAYYGIAPLPDGSFMAGGASKGPAGRAVMMSVYTPEGERVAVKALAGTASRALLALAPAPDGTVIAGGWMKGEKGLGIWVARFDAEGALIGEQALPGERDMVRALRPMGDRMAVAGWREMPDPRLRDGWLEVMPLE